MYLHRCARNSSGWPISTRIIDRQEPRGEQFWCEHVCYCLLIWLRSMMFIQLVITGSDQPSFWGNLLHARHQKAHALQSFAQSGRQGRATGRHRMGQLTLQLITCSTSCWSLQLPLPGRGYRFPLAARHPIALFQRWSPSKPSKLWGCVGDLRTCMYHLLGAPR